MAQSAKRFAALLQEGINAIADRTAKPKGVIRDELGYAIGRKGGSALEYWAYGDGHIPSQPSEVEALARILVRTGELDRGWLIAFLESASYPNRQALTAALFPTAAGQLAEHEPLRIPEERIYAVDGLLAPARLSLPLPSSPSAAKLGTPLRYDLQEAPEPGLFLGRDAELRRLHQWLGVDDCRLVALLGMGGIGKTSLATTFANTLVEASPTLGREQSRFDRILWRSLLNAPPLTDILRQLVQGLSGQQVIELPAHLDEQLRLLMALLQQQRALIMLDNFESIMQTGTRAGKYREGYAAYGQLLQRIAQTAHPSALLLTSRECPQGLERLANDSAHVQLMMLAGLPDAASHELLRARGMVIEQDTAYDMNTRYSGNPLAIKLMAETVHALYSGNLALFLRDEVLIFEDIRDILAQQFSRLSALEQEILIWLAIEREPIVPARLLQNFIQPPTKGMLLEALYSLRRRSLIETRGGRTTFTNAPTGAAVDASSGGEEGFLLQNVVLEYVSDHLVTTICTELETGTLAYFNRYALLKSQSKEYLRASQERLLLQPVAGWLQATFSPRGAVERLEALLSKLRASRFPVPGYAGGNLLNLLLSMTNELHGLDFSNMTIRQAYLQGKRLLSVNFANATLQQTLFTDAFGAIVSVAISPDGQLIAAGTIRGEIRIWQRSTGQLCSICEGHDGYVWSLCFDADGERLVSGGAADHLVRLWDVRHVRTTGVAPCIKSFHGHNGWVNTVACSPDGALVASGGDDRVIYLWDSHSGTLRQILTGHTDAIRALCFSPDGVTLASSSADRTIRLWQITAPPCADTLRCQQILRGHQNWVSALCFSQDGRILYSGSDDQAIYGWRVADGQRLHIFTQPAGNVRALALHPHEARLASAGSSNAIYVWDLQTATHIQTYQGHTNRIRAICFSHDGNILVSGADDQSVRQWETRSGECLQTWQGYANGIGAIAFSPDGAYLACGSDDCSVRYWQVADGKVRIPYQQISWGHTSMVEAIAFNGNGSLLASSGSDCKIQIWDMRNDHQRMLLPRHEKRIFALCFHPTAMLLASGSADQKLCVWDVQTGECLQVLAAHSSFIRTLAFAPNGQLLASGGDDCAIRLWYVDTNNAAVERTLAFATQLPDGHHSWIAALAWHPDSRLCASGSADKTIRLWDTVHGQCLGVYTGHEDCVRTIAFSPDGQILASGSYDQTIHLWHWQTGEIIHTLAGHKGWVRSLSFHPSGRYLASGSKDETIKLWDVASGQCIATVPVEGPYAGLQIAGVTGLTTAQRTVLKALGAVESYG